MDCNDIVCQILNHLNLNNIIKCSTVNKLLKDICDLQYMRLFNDYDNIPVKFFFKISYKQMYIACYELDLFLIRFSRANLANLFFSNKLNFNDKKLLKLPESIGQLINLQELSSSGNQITELPESIGQLINLQQLSLSDNQITELPESIGQLSNLQDLWVNDNKITKLPESLGQLVNCNIDR